MIKGLYVKKMRQQKTRSDREIITWVWFGNFIKTVSGPYTPLKSEHRWDLFLKYGLPAQEWRVLF